jgi:hypothetical protein
LNQSDDAVIVACVEGDKNEIDLELINPMVKEMLGLNS